MRRIDPELVKLGAEVAAATAAGDAAAAAAALKLMKLREKKVMPIYQQIAVQFADLHDTPGRMEATGVIAAQVEWKSSRSYFYWRLRRRLAEFQLRRNVAKYVPDTTPVQASAVLQAWFVDSGAKEADWGDSRKVLAWIGEKQAFLRAKIEALRISSVAAKTTALALECPEGAAAGVVAAFTQMDAMQREVLRQQLAAIH
jgi:acetyl-CoA carboxylase/biotin carboxylase 1